MNLYKLLHEIFYESFIVQKRTAQVTSLLQMLSAACLLYSCLAQLRCYVPVAGNQNIEHMHKSNYATNSRERKKLLQSSKKRASSLTKTIYPIKVASDSVGGVWSKMKQRFLHVWQGRNKCKGSSN